MQNHNAFSELASLADVAKNLRTKKSLGQHFLLDSNLIDSIVANAGNLKGETIIEIGVGPGGLTRSLLQTGAKVIALEKDARCIRALQPIKDIAGDNLQLIECDALKKTIHDLAQEHDFKHCHIIANLPYNIATLLTYNWLKELPHIKSMLLMYQLEVAKRITAPTNCKDYGKLSVISQLLCDVSIVKTLPPECFTPPPRVDSAVVHFIPKQPLVALPPKLPDTLNTAFNQRRKMLRASLKNTYSEEELKAVGISPTQRPEEIAPELFYKLASK